MEEKTTLDVTIYGETYHMKVKDDQEKMLKIVGIVDDMMKQVGEKYPHLLVKDIAILAALNIAESHQKLQEDYRQLINLIEEDKH